MYISTGTIITAGSVLAAILAIGGVLIAVYKWVERQNKQDVDIKRMKDEQCLLTYGILACLDRLQQLGCNHTVPVTREKIEKYLNKAAHDQE